MEETPCGIVYNGTPYYFLKNLQGDIIAIVNANGETVVRYRYDAWGVCTITGDTSNCNIATINPFRYRGYYYDEEIAMYYLQSRYYDPMVGRFINVDEPALSTVLSECILEGNLFCYARNNPISYIDRYGYSPTGALVLSDAAIKQMAALTAANTTLIASVKAFIAAIANIILVVGLLLIVIAAVVTICKAIGDIYTTIEVLVNVKAETYKKYKGQICVYVLTRKERKVNSIFYVGRTKNVVSRYKHHTRTKGNCYMYVVYLCKSLPQSRIVEQAVLAACLTGQFTSIIFGQKPSNKIRGIAKSQASKAIKDLGDEVKETLSMLSCTKESDLLLLLNK